MDSPPFLNPNKTKVCVLMCVCAGTYYRDRLELADLEEGP